MSLDSRPRARFANHRATSIPADSSVEKFGPASSTQRMPYESSIDRR